MHCNTVALVAIFVSLFDLNKYRYGMFSSFQTQMRFPSVYCNDMFMKEHTQD